MKKVEAEKRGTRFDALAVGDRFRFVATPGVVCEKVSPRRARRADATSKWFPVRLAQVVTPEVVR